VQRFLCFHFWKVHFLVSVSEKFPDYAFQVIVTTSEPQREVLIGFRLPVGNREGSLVIEPSCHSMSCNVPKFVILLLHQTILFTESCTLWVNTGPNHLPYHMHHCGKFVFCTWDFIYTIYLLMNYAIYIYTLLVRQCTTTCQFQMILLDKEKQLPIYWLQILCKIYLMQIMVSQGLHAKHLLDIRTPCKPGSLLLLSSAKE
jgi:hypothetical protein